MEYYDAVIAGAGPVGAHLAHLLSEKGLSVLVLEKKRVPGKLACSGLISTRLKELIPLKKELIEHVVFGAAFRSKNACFVVEKKKPVAYVINRPELDRYLTSIAKASGAKVVLGTALESYSVMRDAVIVNNKYSAKVLVGADGAGSIVRRLSGLRGDIHIVNGIISIANVPSKSRIVDVFYGKSIASGFFAWKIPRGKRTEYGLASKKNHIKYFKKFMRIHGLEAADFISHPIVFGNQDTAAERLILVGDAALQVKPFSGGGVVYGLMCAKIAAKAVEKAFKRNDFSKDFFEKNYDAVWKKKFMGPIERGKMLRDMLNSLDDSELDTFFEFAASRKDAIAALGDMDFLS